MRQLLAIRLATFWAPSSICCLRCVCPSSIPAAGADTDREPKMASSSIQLSALDALAGARHGPPMARGRVITGPHVAWKGRRHGRRADRRWGKCWSPQQISRRLPIDFPQDECMRFSHEAIYQALYVQGRGALRRELSACLRTGRSLRVPRARVRQRGKSFITPEVMISQRPAEATDRAVPGHWEGGMIIGPWARA